jgi:CheY-like chemotaxis protein/HPt (histidine-containing phosphotransfer) domain-containing protein
LLGRTADIANNGREALEMWQSGDYGMLLADLHMPEMDGYELTAAVRAAEKTGTGEANKSRLPIIAITANALKGEGEHCRVIGMDDYLSKPVQLANLKAMLEKWLPAAAEIPPGISFGRKSIVGASLLANVSRQQAGSYDRDVPVPVDVNVLKALVGDDPAVIREFLHDFRVSAAKIATELKTACENRLAAQAGALAHKLKSSARSMGALALGELCAAMEQAGKSGDTEALMVVLPKFEMEMAAVDEYLGSSLKEEEKS